MSKDTFLVRKGIKKEEKMLRAILISIVILGVIFAAPKATKPIEENIGVVKVERLETDAVPFKMNVQGYLIDSETGNPVNGTLNDVHFSIWDQSSGGNMIWSSGAQQVVFNNGLFSHTLACSSRVFETGARRWLQIYIGDNFPRIEITSVGFAFKSIKSDTASFATSISRPITPPIGANEISDGAVTTAKIANGAVSGIKTNSEIMLVDGSRAITGDLNMNNRKIINLAAPTANSDAATKNYVDTRPPASHNHDDRYYTETELNTSGAGGQVHWNNVTNKPSSYPPSSHQHSATDITSGTMDINRLPVGTGNNQVARGDHNHDGRYLTGITAGTGISVSGGPPSPTVSFTTSWGDARYAPISGGSGYIQNQNSSAQPATFWINGQGVATGSLNAAMLYGWNTHSSSSNAHGVCGQTSSLNAAGVYGLSNYGDGVWGSTGASGKAGVVGWSSGADGVRGYSSRPDNAGVAGWNTVTSGNRWGGFFQGSSGAYAFVGAVYGGTNYKIIGGGAVSCVMPTREGRKTLFAPECPEPYFEDFGHGILTNGHCHIELDPLFLDCIKTDAQHPMKVFIQLNDDCNGVYVKTGQTGFDVYELQNGKSNASFTYRVVANRKDTDYLRFPKGIEPQEAPRFEPPKIGGEK